MLMIAGCNILSIDIYLRQVIYEKWYSNANERYRYER